MKKISNLLILAVLAIGMGLTSCEGALDDILGEWSRPTKNPSENPESPAVSLATPLTLEVLSEGAGTIVIKSPKVNMKYSKNGATPTTITSTADVTIDVTKGDKVAFYGNGTSINNYNGTQIVGGTAQVKVYGNIMSLLDETGFETKTDLPNDTFVFCDLFRDNTNLTDASGLLLPAEPLAQDCYSNMFMGCTSLTTAPELKATTLAHGCYADMFEGCTALTTAPELKATTLAHGCYTRMFKGCTALTVAPELKAEPLAGDCYFHMFEGCTKLTTAYVKAGYDANCADMFKGCTATGAKLHTTSGNKSSWDNEMGSGKTWPTWTAVDDWN